jgi:hypothetical protein
MATALSIKQEALRLLGELRLASDSETTERRILLDAAYTEGAIDYVQSQGWWNFCMESTTVTATALAGRSIGYAYGTTLPSTWLRTHSVGLRRNGGKYYPIDYRIEADEILSADYEVFVHRYLDRKGNPDNWPEMFAKALAAYLAFDVAQSITDDAGLRTQAWQIYQQRLQEGLAQFSEAPPIPMEDRAWEHAVRLHLEQAGWKFALKTVELTTPSTYVDPLPNYTYAFAKPSDWVRTVRVYKAGSVIRDDSRNVEPPHADELGAIHTNHDPVILRYVSSEAIDPGGITIDAGTSTTAPGWTEKFTEAVYTYLKFKASGDEKIYAAWRAMLKEAILKDALNERPRLHRVGSWVSSRQTRVNREQGY